jgi:hypothetical protein
MCNQDQVGNPLVHGRVSLCRIWYDKQDRQRPRKVDILFSQANQIQIGWAQIAAQCIGLGKRNYRVNAMYIEYQNVATANTVITPPTYDRFEGREYYQNLALSSTRDFLRVPLLIEPTVGVEPGFEDYFNTATGGNRLTFFSQSQGSVGFHGRTFSNVVNSKIFGIALVATPEFSDPSKDIIFSRTYFNTSDQTLKLASSQVGITWDIVFGDDDAE